MSSNGARSLIASRQACLSKARSTNAARISGQGIDLVWPINLRKSRRVAPPLEPSSSQPPIAQLYIPENLSCSKWPSSATDLANEQSKSAAAINPHPFVIHAPSTRGA
eukprot:357329-Chlamydomonas_euryale.AAC.12